MESSIVNRLYKIFCGMSEKQQLLKMAIEAFKDRLEPNLLKLLGSIELSMQEQHKAMATIINRYQDKERLFCDHCKYGGHTKEECYKLYGYPVRWKKRRCQPGGVQNSVWGETSDAATTGRIPMVDLQALEEFKSRLKLSEGSSSFQGARNRETNWYRDHA